MMTKEMMKDYTKVLEKRNKILLIAVIVLACAFVGMTIFAFCQFEVKTESIETYEVQNEVENDGDGNTIHQISTINEEHQLVIIAAIASAALVAIACIITVGVVIYGKSKDKNKGRKTKESDD